jgi:hypothetical protein
VIAGLVLLACATSNGDDAPVDTPTTEPPLRDKKPDDNRDPPKFEATIDPPDAGGGDDDKDPTPGGGDPCIDNGDPGGSENVATKLPETTDCDNDYKTITGVMKGAVDVDFYSLSAKDEGVSTSHPFGCSLDTDFEGETAGTELCVFLRCKNSTMNPVTGCAQGTLSTSDIGMKGCCAAAPGKAVPEWDCSGITDNDSADIFIRVRQIGGDKCLPYKVKYRF